MLEYLFEITQHLLEEISVLLFFVFIMSRIKPFRNVLIKKEMTGFDRAALTVFFGFFSILGTYNGFPIDGAIANTRAVGAIVGGLVGGPVVGMGAGFLAGIHRLFLGGPTMYISALSTVLEGLLAGLLSARFIKQKERWPFALGIGLSLEAAHMALLLLSPPIEQALRIVKAIMLPMLIINPVGVAVFIAILDNLIREREKVEGLAAQLALQIANRTLSYMRKGLNAVSAEQTVKIIFENVDNLVAVAITSRDRILAFEGAGRDHHRPDSMSGIITKSTQYVLETGDYLVAQERSLIGCSDENCPLASKVVVPLTERGKVVGALVLYKAVENDISPFDVELALGLAQLISTQIEVSRGELEGELRARAEIKVLQAQINPHFLFNAINTIVYYCRKEPETARELLLHLGQFYRNNIAGLEEPVDLATEIEHVNSYVRIEMARFQGKLTVEYDIPPECNCLVPPLILQPVVENAIKHGIYPKKKGGKVQVSARLVGDRVMLIVQDDGVGMDQATARRALEDDPTRKNIGLSNVNSRIKSMYGDEFVIAIESNPGVGTTVSIPIPYRRV